MISPFTSTNKVKHVQEQILEKKIVKKKAQKLSLFAFQWCVEKVQNFFQKLFEKASFEDEFQKLWCLWNFSTNYLFKLWTCIYTISFDSFNFKTETMMKITNVYAKFTKHKFRSKHSFNSFPSGRVEKRLTRNRKQSHQKHSST